MPEFNKEYRPLKTKLSTKAQWVAKIGLAVFFLAMSVFLLIGTDWQYLLVDDTKYSKEIAEAAKKHGLDKQLVRALIFRESRFDTFAVGTCGEIGLMQVLPEGAVADWARVNKKKVPSRNELMNPKTNLEIGCWYLAKAMKKWQKYRCQLYLALAQYNAGEKRAEKWCPKNPNGEVIDRINIQSTKKYVKFIIRRYEKYKRTPSKK